MRPLDVICPILNTENVNTLAKLASKIPDKVRICVAGFFYMAYSEYILFTMVYNTHRGFRISTTFYSARMVFAMLAMCS